MEMTDFVCSCLGIDGAVIDRLCDQFNVDLSEEDVHAAIRDSGDDLTDTGRMILQTIMAYIVENNPLLDAEKFDCDVSLPSYPDFYYDGKNITSQEDLDDIADELYDEED